MSSNLGEEREREREREKERKKERERAKTQTLAGIKVERGKVTAMSESVERKASEKNVEHRHGKSDSS
jgi:hypothetical protein